MYAIGSGDEEDHLDEQENNQPTINMFFGGGQRSPPRDLMSDDDEVHTRAHEHTHTHTHTRAKGGGDDNGDHVDLDRVNAEREESEMVAQVEALRGRATRARSDPRYVVCVVL